MMIEYVIHWLKQSFIASIIKCVDVQEIHGITRQFRLIHVSQLFMHTTIIIYILYIYIQWTCEHKERMFVLIVL